MSLFAGKTRRWAEVIDALVFVNPFTPRRLELEREALGARFRDEADAWRAGPGHRNRNVGPLLRRVREAVEAAQCRLGEADERETEIYGSLVRYLLYYDYEEELFRLSQAARAGRLREIEVKAFERFRKSFESMTQHASTHRRILGEAGHLWALAFQLRRAFEQIFLGIVGASLPASRLRAQIWESVFTHDMRRYQRALYDRMHETNTLILGPSGTGKEVVARAIGESRYIPFEPRSRRFTEETHESFLPLNISALAETLVESELFGHKKGSFTGATADRAGFLEACPTHGTVFLDEIGELSEELQVKLLRTLQERELSRIGERRRRKFVGKLVAATNRDLAQAVSEGSIRADFYYRLRADSLVTPSLQEQLADTPDDLPRLIRTLVSRIVPPQEAEAVEIEASEYIERKLSDYSWPGNVRELEQCLRSLVVHGHYETRGVTLHNRAMRLGTRMIEGHYSMDDLSDLYVTLAHARYGNLSETGRRLELDRRTVRAKLRPELLDE